MRRSAVPVTDREALQCFLGQPVADMDVKKKKKKCLLSERCFSREAMCCHRLPRNASAQPQNMRWGWKKTNLLLVIRPDCLSLATFLPHALLSLPLSESSIIAKWLASVNIFHVGWWYSYSCFSFEWQEVVYEVIGHFITWFVAALEGIFGSWTSCDRILVLWLDDNLLPNLLF